ncbi:MAG: radical SAM protein [Peptococcales bacterium]|jgi:radical SAM superfamily enzyme YgiQ (UPF0313 family)
MQYDFPLYRPPSEAMSLILQITLGCSHNKCTFCSMYKTKKYRVKTPQEIQEHLDRAKRKFPHATKIFLADGNVLAMDALELKNLVERLYIEFPYLERVTSYAGPKDILAKTENELRELRKAGLTMLYLGVESGNAQVLKNVKKGVTPREMVEAGQKAIKAGFKLSCMIISGLGGKELWEEHALDSAKVISEINPDYFALLTLLVEEETSLYNQVEQGKFELLKPNEVISETKLMLENLELSDCVFRSNHPSNYLSLKGVLNKDKDRLVDVLAQAQQEQFKLRPEGWRGL